MTKTDTARRASLLAGFAAAALIATPALAQPGKGMDREAEITRADALAKAEERFDKLDANGDGFVTESEIEAAKAEREAERAARRAERAETGERGDRGQRGRRGPRRGGEDRLERMDTSGDGTLSKAEAMTAAQERFDRADADGDGVITAAERRAAREAMRDARRAERRAAE